MVEQAPDKDQRIQDAAARALKEVSDRKKSDATQALPTELGGRDGPEPTRFGDWEKDGVVSDF